MLIIMEPIIYRGIHSINAKNAIFGVELDCKLITDIINKYISFDLL